MNCNGTCWRFSTNLQCASDVCSVSCSIKWTFASGRLMYCHCATHINKDDIFTCMWGTLWAYWTELNTRLSCLRLSILTSWWFDLQNISNLANFLHHRFALVQFNFFYILKTSFKNPYHLSRCTQKYETTSHLLVETYSICCIYFRTLF